MTYFGWRVAPDGSAVAVFAARWPRALPDWWRRRPARSGGRGRVARRRLGIDSRLYVTDSPTQSTRAFLLDPITGRRQPWVEFRPGDPAGLMNMALGSLVTTPDGRGYGYTWHRATSDLFLVRGWS